jgi:segregation and condensation protein A
VERLDVVVRFLAVLELFKQGFVDLEQATSFGELTVTWLGAPEADGDWTRALDAVDAYEG